MAPSTCAPSVSGFHSGSCRRSEISSKARSAELCTSSGVMSTLTMVCSPVAEGTTGNQIRIDRRAEVREFPWLAIRSRAGMLSKRVIVVAGDKPLQKRLIAGAMAAGGAVQAFGGPDELSARIDADLIVYAMPQPTDPGFRSL